MLTQSYKPAHGQNLMAHEGDVANARRQYFERKSQNLHFLLAHRYLWMNRYIPPDGSGIDVGCGAGLSKEFIRAREFLLTDFADYDWLDHKHVDALATPFPDARFDFVVSSNMIHHVPRPPVFFREMSRILKPGGVLLIQEINASLTMRAMLRLMRHEGYSFQPDVFDENVICTDPEDLWSANCAIPNLLFDRPDVFKARFPDFHIEYHRYRELFCFLNSGGVIAKTRYLPLPRMLLHMVKATDDALAFLAPKLFALQRQIVLRRVT